MGRVSNPSRDFLRQQERIAALEAGEDHRLADNDEEERAFIDGNANLRIRVRDAEEPQGLTLCEIFGGANISNQMPPRPVPPQGRALHDILQRIASCAKPSDARPDWLKVCMGVVREPAKHQRLSRKKQKELELIFHRHKQCLSHLLHLAQTAGNDRENAMLLPSTLLPPQA